MTTRPFSRARRLYLIIQRLNAIHCARRLRGLPTAHLYPRSRRLTQAWLAVRLSEDPS